MPTLDPIQPKKTSPAQSPNQTLQPRRPTKKKPIPAISNADTKRGMWMWLAIGATMAIILMLWWVTATGQNSVLRKGGSDDLLYRIGQSFGKLFSGSRSTTSNTNAAQEQHLQELRQRVFPQFSNLNESE